MTVKKKLVLVVGMMLAVFIVKAQGAGDILIGAGLDILKSNNTGF